MKRICVYCGSSTGNKQQYIQAARKMGIELANQNIGLVYGGSKIGLMREIADTVLAKGGEVIGVMPQALVDREVAHNSLTELKVVSSMHERKAEMARLADGFIAMPGGMGTMEEILEIMTWSQLGIHKKPIALLNTLYYFENLLKFFKHATEEQFLKKEYLDQLIISEHPEQLIKQMSNYEPRQIDKLFSKPSL